MVTFDRPPEIDNFSYCVKKALENQNRKQLIKCLAEYRIVPVKNQWANTEYGRSEANFERRGDEKSDIPTQSLMFDLLGVNEPEDVKPVREKIRNHPAWGQDA
ncbi:hypothetical protein [Natrinema sp. 74]|uniref:hypothetical protein n=1 Tax=Natrinema sp. 74 TaxID=3384159 RepID=UPI0038D44E06